MRRRVDLPQPLGPSKALKEPLGIANDTWSTATTEPKLLLTLLAMTQSVWPEVLGRRSSNGRDFPTNAIL